LAAAHGTPSIDAALSAHYRDEPTYKYALIDLNGDGILDAVALLTDNRYCGSGGCSMAILRGTSESFLFISSTTITREPIRILQESRHGWKTLSVAISGGGAKSGDVILRFDGKHYPSNPSTQPHATAKDVVGAITLSLQVATR
jgi:hypothetical protein